MPNNPNMLAYPGSPGMLEPEEEEQMPGMLNRMQGRETIRNQVQTHPQGFVGPRRAESSRFAPDVYSEFNPQMPGLGFTQEPTPLQMFSMQLNSPLEADRGEAALESVKYAIDAVIPAGLGAAAWQAMKGEKALPPLSGTFGGPAFHGSPHRFDKFDIDKIGTGEGAQSYGHGLYFAESPGVAKSYQRQLTGRGAFTIDDVPVPENVVAHQLDVLEYAQEHGDEGLKTFLNGLDSRIASQGDAASLELRDMADYAEGLIGKKVKRATGALYEVDIPDEQIAQMLDWDKPLSEQPESVRKALARVAAEDIDVDPFESPALAVLRGGRHPRDATWVPTGEDIYGELRDRYRVAGAGDTAEMASKELNSLGIPGIRYLDQASRGTGKGTRNLVLFSDENINILKRDGKAVGGAEDIAKRIEKDTGASVLLRESAPDSYGRSLVNVDELYVPPAGRGQGTGTKALEEITSWADNNGKHLVLNADSTIRGAKGSKAADNRLMGWYKRHGFVRNTGRNKDFTLGGPTQKNVMYREPR